MRTVIVGFAAVLLAARAACAASILFATAASTGGVDGFCIRRDGSLAPTPKIHVNTAGAQPRRLLVGNNTLYVAEVDRIEAFPIGAVGALKAPTSTKVTAGLDPRDIALSPDGTTLYATHHGFISAYTLEAGAFAKDAEPSSCVQGVAAANYLDLQVTDRLLYASADDAPGRVEVYCLCPRDDSAADAPCRSPNDSPLLCPADSPPGSLHKGSLPQTGCGPVTKKHPAVPPKWPDSERTRIQNPKAIVVAGDMIYVEERALRRMIAFRLQPDGTFCDRKRSRTDKNDIDTENCSGFDQLATKRCARRQAKKQRQQCPASTTAEVLQYEALVLQPGGPTLLGTQFFKGRVDSYRLVPYASQPALGRVRLPKQPSVESEQDPRMTPVRLTVGGDTVYVAGGEVDRVVAYRLDKTTGVLADKQPFSRTDEQKDSFPNDVAVSMLSAPCE